jgi:hypothetical protein
MQSRGFLHPIACQEFFVTSQEDTARRRFFYHGTSRKVKRVLRKGQSKRLNILHFIATADLGEKSLLLHC